LWKCLLRFGCKYNKNFRYYEIFVTDISSCNSIVTCRTREEDILRFLGASQRIKTDVRHRDGAHVREERDFI
jgi:hypothetical protein